ncbi:hypothetical protein [Longibacter salinarum]|uniref:hypothetical protein n=1 Tax=Longibacter salinarum TaxID=1850348 RepID=UPI0015CF5065|nr:hypothetical protein [Longibacter salinarum]
MSVPDIQHALELLRKRDVDAAISSLKQKVDEIPAHLTAHVLLARAYEAKREWTLALRSWENAHFLMPNSPIVTAGKERVLEKIREEDDLSEEGASEGGDTKEPPVENRGDASPSPTPPQPAPPEQTSSEDEAHEPNAEPEDTSSDSAASDPITPPPPADEATEERSESVPDGQTESEDDDGSSPNRIAAQAQALLSQNPGETSASDEPTATDEPADSGPPSEPSAQAKQMDEAHPAPPSTPDPSAPEIPASRTSDGTGYRPDTAIIDAAASLLAQEPTPVAKGPESEPTEDSNLTTGESKTSSPADTNSDAEPSDADSFIPDFVARQTGGTSEPKEGSSEDSPAQQPAVDGADDPRSDDEADRPSTGTAPTPEADDTAQERELSIPNPDDLMPSDTQLGGSDDNDDEDDGLSELEKLRRSAEQEARSRGARGLSQPEISSASDAPDEQDDTIGDLDRLIQDLESARIEPRPDLDDLPEPDLEDDVEDLVSETLARIYAAQSQYREAARIYVKLASQEPANARDHLEQAAEMRKQAEKKEAQTKSSRDASDA